MSALVFVSHITEEAVVANLLRDEIQKRFLGMIDVFVASDGDSIKMGDRWLDRISSALQNCAVQIVVCSPQSVGRPWINFEAGAAWVRKVPVIPLCHSGMTPPELPIPLLQAQGAELSDALGMQRVFAVLATALGSNLPGIDFSDFVEKIRAFEQDYTFWDKCNRAFGVLADACPEILPELLGTKHGLRMNLAPKAIETIEIVSGFLRRNQILEFYTTGSETLFSEIGSERGGVRFGCVLKKLPRADQIMSARKFNPCTSRTGSNSTPQVFPGSITPLAG